MQKRGEKKPPKLGGFSRGLFTNIIRLGSFSSVLSGLGGVVYATL